MREGQTRGRRNLRVAVESCFLAGGLAYLAHLLLNTKTDYSTFFMPGGVIGCLLGAGVFFLNQLILVYVSWHNLRCLTPQGQALHYWTVFSGLSIAGLGKYIPGKLWTLLAFNEVGAKVGISRVAMSMLFFISLGMGIAVSLIAYLIRVLVHPVFQWYVILMLIATGVAILPRLSSWSRRRLSLPAGFRGSVFVWLWLAQWINFVLSGIGYHFIASVQNPGRVLDFGTLSSYYLGYMAGYLALLVPSGIGVREGVVIHLDGAGEAAAVMMARGILTALDLLQILLVFLLLLWRKQDRKILWS